MPSQITKTAKRARRTPTIKDIAAATSLSACTVSKVLNQQLKVRPETRERILSAVKRLGYVPDGRARSLRTGRTHRIGMVIPTLENPFFASTVNDANRAASAAGYDTIFISTDNVHYQPDRPRPGVIRRLLDIGIDGLIMYSPPMQADVDLAFARRIPIVSLVHRPLEHASYLLPDIAGGAESAIRHLCQLGHRRILLLGIGQDSDRYPGVLRALEGEGLPPSASELLPFEPRLRDSSLGGYLAMRSRFSTGDARPTAIFAINDQVAIGAIKALRELGLDVPRDVAVVGFDDSLNADSVYPPLTTVGLTHLKLGRQAISMLVELIRHPHRIVKQQLLPLKLIVRESCGATLSGSRQQQQHALGRGEATHATACP